MKKELSLRTQQAVKVTILGLIANFMLVVTKILAGIFGLSAAMIADGLHSLSDSVSDVFLLFGFRIADKPPDDSHNYGHGKVETLLTALISIIIMGAGLLILANGSALIFDHIFGGERLSRPNWIALIAALISIIAKEILYVITKKAGEKTNNDALIANAWHHRTDSLSSVATLFGIGGAVFLGDDWVILDPLAAILVAIFIITIGSKLLVKTIKEMLETSIGEEKKEELIKTIDSVQGVIGFHKLRTRKIGNYFALDVHIEVNRYLNVIQAHDIATDVEKELKRKFGHDNVISVHVEPYGISEQADPVQ